MAQRRSKRRISSSDDEESVSEQATFVNNSDYQQNNSEETGPNSRQNDVLNESASEDESDAETGENVPLDESDEDDDEDGDVDDSVVSGGSERSFKSANSVKESDEINTPDISRANDTSDTSDEVQKDTRVKGVGSLISDVPVPDLGHPTAVNTSALEATATIEPTAPNDASTATTPVLKATAPDSEPLDLAESKLSYSQQQSVMNIASPKKRESFTTPPSNEPRLVIEQLVLTNFKSYAGRQVIGPFNASFSAVIGPNGSGKSNVIDSMLFVFGFRANKMRQSKLSELIHNSEGKRLDFCQVDIHFNHVIDENEESTVVSDSQLVVTRKAFKNNSSQYYINGKTSNYTEVTTLLKDKGIDLDHKRFLILQGEVESIAQMKPKAEKESDDGLLEYLEDIIGTSHYKEMIETNLTKVEELNELCIEKSNRFELVEKDTIQLEDKKVEALMFLEKEKKLIDLKSVQFQINIGTNTEALNAKQESFNKLQQDYENEKEKNQELNQQLEDDLKEQNRIKKEVAGLQNEISKRKDKVKTINKAIVSVDEKIKSLTAKLKKSTKTKETSEQSLSMAQGKLNSDQETASQYKEELDKLSKDLEYEKGKLDDIRNKMTSKTSAFTAEIEQLNKQLDPWNDKLKEKENSISVIDSSIEMLTNQKQQDAKKLEDAKERLINIKTEGKQKEVEYQENSEKIQHINEQIQLGEETVNNERTAIQTQKNDLISLRSKVQDSVSTRNDNQNKNRVLSSLSRLAKSGRINGFYGRLGDLGIIDDKFDIAISTACPALDSIVVETVETAQTCIQYLRKNNLGYGNFICLNKLRQFNMNPIKTPGNPSTVKRLFDLIKPKHEKFLPAFYSKLYDTLVASNLQEARQVAYGVKRFKVVTLDGKVVDTSGTMSGGGNSFAKGGMILASSKMKDQMDLSDEDVNQMQQDLKMAESRYDEAYMQFQTKESQLRSLKDLKPEVEFTISKLKLEIEALSSERKEVSALCKKLISEQESDKNSQLDEEISAKEQEKEEISKSKDSLKLEMKDSETKIAELEEKIMEAGGVELRVQSSKVDSIKQKIEILTEKTSNERMTLRKLENEIKRYNKSIQESEKEIGKTEEELNSIRSQDSNKQEELDELNKEVSEFEHQVEQLEEKLEASNDTLEEKNKSIKEFKSFEIELNNKLEKIGGTIKRIKMDLKSDQQSLDGLIVRDTSEYIDWLEGEERSKYDGSEIKQLTPEELESIDLDATNDQIETLEQYMKEVKTDIEILKEYGAKISEFKVRKEELTSSINSRDEIKNYCEDLKRKRLDEFMEGFNTISLSLKEMYQMITMGGNAELELVDSLDPFAEGILFSVMPPKKSWRNISNLSGGEKTLSSLALVFALHRYKPTPLYVMDEIDAALDFRNVSIVANYIKERTKNGQFIVISLRNNMFELAKQLVGIYKVNNMTRSTSLKNKEFF